ncbi:MAG: DUF6431 domain-containing protein [Aminipila sp.]
MVLTDNYTIEYDEKRDRYKVKNLTAPICPDCGQLLSGYDTRLRHVVNDMGVSQWFVLRRLRCTSCKKLHLEAPDFIEPKKHYKKDMITDVVAGNNDFCPADNATIRRWRKNHPPGLPLSRQEITL